MRFQAAGTIGAGNQVALLFSAGRLSKETSSRGEKHILFQSPDGSPKEMLFDLMSDPLEERNLASASSDSGAYRSLLEEHAEMNRIARAASGNETVDVDPDTLRRLRALGYLN